MSRSPASLQAAIVAALVSLSAFSACGDDSPDEEAAGGTAGGTARGGSSGKAGRGGNSSSAGESNAGAPAGDGGEGATSAGGTSPGDGGSSAGGDPTGGGGDNSAAGAFQVPGAGPGGVSVYAVECSGDTAMCGTEHAHCLGLMLPEDQIGYSCSNHCDTVADCSTVDTGAEAEPGCVPFTMESRCMLICHQQGTDYACPDGMDCYIYPNATFGYCLWM